MHDLLNQIGNVLSEAFPLSFLHPSPIIQGETWYPLICRRAWSTWRLHHTKSRSTTLEISNVSWFDSYFHWNWTYFTKRIKTPSVLTNSLHNINYNSFKKAQTFSVCSTKISLGSLNKRVYCHLSIITGTHPTTKFDPSPAVASMLDLPYI
jgi:hypothetical protein